ARRAPSPATACPPIQCGMSSGAAVRAAAAGEESVLAAMGVARRVCAQAPTAPIIDQLRTAPHTPAPFMSIELLFPTLVYRRSLPVWVAGGLSADLRNGGRQ